MRAVNGGRSRSTLSGRTTRSTKGGPVSPYILVNYFSGFVQAGYPRLMAQYRWSISSPHTTMSPPHQLPTPVSRGHTAMTSGKQKGYNKDSQNDFDNVVVVMDECHNLLRISVVRGGERERDVERPGARERAAQERGRQQRGAELDHRLW